MDYPLTVEYISDRVMGPFALLTHITHQAPFNMCGEQKAIELFVQVTSDDPAQPLRGSELWGSLKEKFSDGNGGIDGQAIMKKMAGAYMRSL